MEHRECGRKPIVLELELVHRFNPLGRFLTRNISVDGMFLETPWLGVIPKDVVELQWDFDSTHTMTGEVIHRSIHGLGIRLLDFSLAAYLPLLESTAGRETGSLPFRPAVAAIRHAHLPSPAGNAASQ